MSAHKRLFSEYKELISRIQEGILASPTEDILTWDAFIFGEEKTPFEGGVFSLTMDFSVNYPNDPPCIRFVSEIFHPNIYQDGSICLDVLGERWLSSFGVKIALDAVRKLLSEPNPYSPANPIAAKLFLKDQKEYKRRVLICVKKTWIEGDGRRSQNNKKDEEDQLYQAWLEEHSFWDEVEDLGLRHLFQQGQEDVIGIISIRGLFEECICHQENTLIVCGFCGHQCFGRLHEDCAAHPEAKFEDIDKCSQCQEDKFLSKHQI